MEHYNRSTIQEEPIAPSCFGTITPRDACFRLPCCTHKIRCKEQVTPIIDADGEQKHRFSLRDGR